MFLSIGRGKIPFFVVFLGRINSITQISARRNSFRAVLRVLFCRKKTLIVESGFFAGKNDKKRAKNAEKSRKAVVAPYFAAKIFLPLRRLI